jgi:hypothetical protein
VVTAVVVVETAVVVTVSVVVAAVLEPVDVVTPAITVPEKSPAASRPDVKSAAGSRRFTPEEV